MKMGWRKKKIGVAKNSAWRIVAKNTFTLFNLVNVILAVMVAMVGSYKNMLFIGIAIANTLISVINELRAKKIVDKLRLVSEQKPTILENGRPRQVAPEQVKVGDLLVLTLGDQILYDSELASGFIEVNEAFITGEQENIAKHPRDKLISGSFVVAGTATAKVVNVGADNFVTKLQTEASYIKTADSKLFTLMNNIVKYISWALIPVGALLLWSRWRTEADTTTAVTSTVAALINMIPEGLILLTSSVLALATIRLSRRKILVQDLYAIETLARVDTICLDKTGTLTTGKMAVCGMLLPDGTTVNITRPTSAAEKSFLRALTAIVEGQTAENATISALRKKLARSAKFKATDDFGKITEVIPFSSERKYSGVRTEKAEYLMGAVEFVTDNQDDIKWVKGQAGGYRVLAVMKREDTARSRNASSRPSLRGSVAPYLARRQICSSNDSIPRVSSSKLLGIIRLEDEIRPTAPKLIEYFYANEIAIKIISGDDLEAVTAIAEKVGVKGLKGVNLSDEKRHDYRKLVREYDIFTRVTPSEKKELIRALRAEGKTVAMTGDGVNDILAMKEADVSLAIGEGADAARRVAKFVLLDSGFEAVPAIIDEGRQSINNLERSTSLFLAKTVYASLLAVLFVVLPLAYPFTPIEMTLLNFACIGFPGLVLALEHNTARIKNQFISNIKKYAVPTGVAVAVAMLILSVVASINGLDKHLLTTLSASITFAIDLVLIYQISKPLNLFRAILILLIILIVVGALLLPISRAFFEFA